MSSLGELIALVRQRAGLSQSEASRQIGCSRSTVHNWERGAPPSLDGLSRFLQACDATETEKALALDLAGAQHSQASDEDAA